MQTGLFKVITIETQGTCNNTCYFCRYGQKRWLSENRPLEKLPTETILLILENLKKLDYSGRVSFYGISEPLMDERLPTLVKTAKQYLQKAHHTLITNGRLLTQEKADELFDCGLDHLTVSAYNEETFTSALNIRGHAINVKGRRPDKKHHWDNRGGNIAQFKKQIRKADCLRPSTGLMVNAKGAVVLCCADLYGDVVMGHVLNNTLEEIWFGERFKKYRAHLSTGNRSGLELCEMCDHDGTGHGREGNH